MFAVLCWAVEYGMNQIGLSKAQLISIWKYNLEDLDCSVSNNILIPQQVDIWGIIGLTETKSEISDRLHSQY